MSTTTMILVKVFLYSVSFAFINAAAAYYCTKATWKHRYPQLANLYFHHAACEKIVKENTILAGASSFVFMLAYLLLKRL